VLNCDLTGTSADTVDVLKLAPAAALSENGVATFDGKSLAVDVQQDDVFGANGLAKQFTVSTWLRRSHGLDDQFKQHVMCSSDAQGRSARLVVRFCLVQLCM